MNIVFDKQVLYDHALRVYTIFCVLVDEKNQTQCFSLLV
jgi:hypothetical protein